MKVIDSFTGEYFFLSNYYVADVEYNGLVFKNNEAAFQSQKCPERAKEFINLIPDEAKKLGRKVPLRKDWDSVKDEIMLNICRNKFSQNKYLQNKLVCTGNVKLIEGNTWNDRYWGVCNGEGKNHLGKILMSIRDEFRDSYEGG